MIYECIATADCIAQFLDEVQHSNNFHLQLDVSLSPNLYRNPRVNVEELLKQFQLLHHTHKSTHMEPTKNKKKHCNSFFLSINYY